VTKRVRPVKRRKKKKKAPPRPTQGPIEIGTPFFAVEGTAAEIEDWIAESLRGRHRRPKKKRSRPENVRALPDPRIDFGRAGSDLAYNDFLRSLGIRIETEEIARLRSVRSRAERTIRKTKTTANDNARRKKKRTAKKRAGLRSKKAASLSQFLRKRGYRKVRGGWSNGSGFIPL
jgi:hypothetical protein